MTQIRCLATGCRKRNEGCGTRAAGAAASSTADERSWNFSGAGYRWEIDALLTGSSVNQF